MPSMLVRSAPPVTARALSATALYAVTFRPNANGRIATVQLCWEEPDTHKVTEINGNFNTWDLAGSFEQTDPRYQLAVVVMQYAEILCHYPWVTGPSASQLVEHAYRISLILWEDPDVTEFAYPRIPGAWSAGPIRLALWASNYLTKKSPSKTLYK